MFLRSRQSSSTMPKLSIRTFPGTYPKSRPWRSHSSALWVDANLLLHMGRTARYTQASFLSPPSIECCTHSRAYEFASDVSMWNTSSCNDMTRMVWKRAMSQLDVGYAPWLDPRSNLIVFSVYKFAGAFAFNSDLSQWNVSSVARMISMVRGPWYRFDRTTIDGLTRCV
jgi:Mycoplasma protein of unknown function, DUF285